MNTTLIRDDLAEATSDNDTEVTVVYGDGARIYRGRAGFVDDVWLYFLDPAARVRLDVIIAYWYGDE